EIASVGIESLDTAVEFDVLRDTLGSLYQPLIYVHAEDQKCTAYRPASLAVVQRGEPRGLVHAKISNEKCYQDLAEDEEGIPDPDNTEQPAPPDNERNPA